MSEDGREALPKRYMVFDKDELEPRVENPVKNIALGEVEIDLKEIGKELETTKRIIVDDEFQPVHTYKKVEIWKKLDGELKEKPLTPTQANIKRKEYPLIVDASSLKEKKDVFKEFLFKRKYFVKHTDGGSFQRLDELAKKLDEENKMAPVVWMDENGDVSPIVLRRGGKMFPRAFIEGKVEGEKFCLILHLSRSEFKLPHFARGKSELMERKVEKKDE